MTSSVPRTRPRARLANDRGSVSVFVVFFTITVLLLASMLVDLGDAVNAQERAADLAEQAARAAADSLNLQSLRDGQVVIDQGTACASAAQLVANYAQTSGLRATLAGPLCRYPRADKVTVWVSITTTPVITVGFGSFTMTAHESACAETAEGQAC